MVQNLVVAHRHKPLIFSSELGPVWNTCLRSVALVDEEFADSAGTTETVYNGRDAYRFLLELACGLHSPMVGETEVFGQFKIFAGEWVSRRPQNATLVQRLLSDAKALRTQYLNQIGAQSYGSWVRKKLVSTRVHMIGGGQLAREILPYVLKRSESVTLHVRQPEKVDFFNGTVERLRSGGFDSGAVIIAAPVQAAEVEAWLAGQAPTEIFDLRETSVSDPVSVSSSTKVHRLSDIFGQIEQTKQRLLPVVERVKAEIQARADKLAHQGLLRPQGWDDLSA